MQDSCSTGVRTDYEDSYKFLSPKTTYPASDDIVSSQISPFSLRLNSFADFLDGRINSHQLLQANNCPRLHKKQLLEASEKVMRDRRESKGMVILGPLLRFKHKYKHVKTNSEERAGYLKTKLASLNDLISSKVKNRKKDNDEKRRRSLQNVALLKSLVEASENATERLAKCENLEKLIPQTKNLKTVTISYDDQKIARKEFLKQKYKSLTSPNPKLFLKTQLQDSSKQFLKDLTQLNDKKQQNLDKLSRMKLVSDNKLSKQHKFDLFVKGVLTYKDIELYDYIHQQQQDVQYQCNFTEQNDDQNIVPITTTRKLLQQQQKNKHKKQTTLAEANYKEILDVSDTSSLQSAYEIHLDNLYSQTMDVKKQLGKKQNLPKKIKQMIRLDELEKQTLHTSVYKLQH